MAEQAGWNQPDPVATLYFDKPPFVGAEIDVSLSLSVGNYFAATNLMEQLTEDDTTKDGMMRAAREIGTLFFERGLRSWNLRDPRTGEPTPITLEGVLSLDVRVLTRIVSTWIAWLGDTPLPLGPTSPEPVAPARPNRKQRRSTGSSSTAGSAPKKSRTRTLPSSSASAA